MLEESLMNQEMNNYTILILKPTIFKHKQGIVELKKLLKRFNLTIIAKQKRHIGLVDIQQYKEQDIINHDVNFAEVREFERGDSEVWLLKRDTTKNEEIQDQIDSNEGVLDPIILDIIASNGIDITNKKDIPITNLINMIKIIIRIFLNSNCNDYTDIKKYKSFIHAPGNEILDLLKENGRLRSYILENMKNISHFFLSKEIIVPINDKKNKYIFFETFFKSWERIFNKYMDLIIEYYLPSFYKVLEDSIKNKNYITIYDFVDKIGLEFRESPFAHALLKINDKDFSFEDFHILLKNNLKKIRFSDFNFKNVNELIDVMKSNFIDTMRSIIGELYTDNSFFFDEKDPDIYIPEDYIEFFVENFEKIVYEESINTSLEEILKLSFKSELNKVVEDLKTHKKELEIRESILLEIATKNMFEKLDSSSLIPVSFEKTTKEGVDGISTLVYSKERKKFEKSFTSFSDMIKNAKTCYCREM